MRKVKPYKPPARTEEDNRALLNWLSTRVTDDGRRCHPDHLYEWSHVEKRLRLVHQLGLTVQPSVYLPRPEQPQKGRARRAA